MENVILIELFIIVGGFIFLIKKIEKRINEYKEEIKSLKEKLENNNIQTNERISKDDFIDRLLASSKKFENKYNEIKKNITSQMNSKKEYTKEEKREYATRMKEYKIKGEEFEKFVGNNFKNKGYQVIFHGLEKGKKDKGIDLICTKDNTIILIQCKNWKAQGRKIKHTHLKEFLGNCTVYEKEKNLLNNDIQRIFITSNYILDKCAKKYLEKNTIVQYEVQSF